MIHVQELLSHLWVLYGSGNVDIMHNYVIIPFILKCTYYMCVTHYNHLFRVILHSFSPDGTVTMKKDVTDVNPGRYSMRITAYYTLSFKNGSLYSGRVYQYIRFYILGEFEAGCKLLLNSVGREGEREGGGVQMVKLMELSGRGS